jgi:hypothetical protein
VQGARAAETVADAGGAGGGGVRAQRQACGTRGRLDVGRLRTRNGQSRTPGGDRATCRFRTALPPPAAALHPRFAASTDKHSVGN